MIASVRHGDPCGLVLTCEHSANQVPEGLALASPEMLASHRGYDLGALDLSNVLLDALGGALVRSYYSRLFVDLNRGVDELAAVPPTMDGVPIPANQLDDAARARRLAGYHDPYHDLVDATLDEAKRTHERVFLLSIHSYTPHLGDERREVEAGVLFDDHEDLAFALLERLSAEGFDARPNEPYSGYGGLIYSANRHGKQHRIPYLELEVRNDLLAPPLLEHTARRVLAALHPLLPTAKDRSR